MTRRVMMDNKAKLLAKQINICLDELGVPNNSRERSLIFSKMLHIPKQTAWGLLEGSIYPDEHLVKKIVTELEIEKLI